MAVTTQFICILGYDSSHIIMSSSSSSNEAPIELYQRSQPQASGARKAVNEVNVVQLTGDDVELDRRADLSDSSNSAHDDIRGMRRMGKEQQFERTFRQLSITSFVSLATASWEIGLF